MGRKIWKSGDLCLARGVVRPDYCGVILRTQLISSRNRKLENPKDEYGVTRPQSAASAILRAEDIL